jgi:hypothetical protein
MKMLPALSCLCAALLCASAAAQVAPTVPASPDAAPGNLPADFYPRATCVKPDRTKLDRFDDMEVLRYNRMIKDFNVCSKTYLVNAQNDAAYVLGMLNAQVSIVNGETPPVLPSAPGNLPAGFYPASACVRPDKAEIGAMPSFQKVPVVAATGKPSTAEGQSAMDAMAAYNQRVARYNLQITAFSACSKDYIAKARIDMARIQAAVQTPN